MTLSMLHFNNAEHFKNTTLKDFVKNIIEICHNVKNLRILLDPCELLD